MKIMTIFGTRPEAIKLAPLILELEKRKIEQIVCVTGQHRQMLDQMLSIFNIEPTHDLDLMTQNQSISEISSRALTGLEPIIRVEKPDLVIVQGDTTTTLMGALAAFYNQVPVAHIEAGLRTDNRYNPFPEEMNRRLVSQISELHIAATEKARQNLLSSGIDSSRIFVTGNTVIDALLKITSEELEFEDSNLKSLDLDKKIILVTTHRRENLGEGMESIFRAIKRLSIKHTEVQFVFPIHMNPKIRKHAEELLKDQKNILLTQPVSYRDIAKLMKLSYLVMTDSGGIQEEAPALGKPVLVLRSTTERPEGIDAGTAILAGVDEEKIYYLADSLIEDQEKYKRMAQAVNPYGDGAASIKIADIIKEKLENDSSIN